MEKNHKTLIGTGAEHIRNKTHSVNKQWVKECEEYIDNNLKKELEKIDGVFLPGDNFYVNGEPREVLRYMCAKILEWLQIDLKKDELVIDFYEKMEPPGIYTEIEGQKYILIKSDYKHDVFAIGAILAHELMHFYLIGRKNLKMENTLENELLTDLCTIKFGLGLAIVNGMHYSNSWFSSILLLFVGILRWSSEKLSFGYFDPHQYGNLVYKNLVERKITIKDIGGYIKPTSRTFLSQGIGSFWKVKKESKVIDFLVRKKKKWMAVKLAIIIALFTWLAWPNPEYEAQQAALQQQKNYIENLESYLLTNEAEATKLMEEFTKLETKLNEYETLGNTEAYNALVPEYNKKLEALTYYKKQYEEYKKQIDNYNSNLK